MPTLARILIVDDEPDLRFMVRLIFERAGIEVEEAAHGAAALQLIKDDRPPDLILTDMMMPVMNGTELIERLKADPRTASIPVLALTANPEAAPHGAVVVGKPFVPESLVELATSLIESAA